MDFVIALVLAAFTILFGARDSDATENQRGLMLAIAVESLVKISAFLRSAYLSFTACPAALGP